MNTNDMYIALHDIYFFHPVNEKIEDIIIDALNIDSNIVKLQNSVQEYCCDNKCTLEECWLHLVLELRLKNYYILKDDIINSFYAVDSDILHVEMLKEAFRILDYEV